MEIQQIYTSCLAQGAYYIENNGEAAIIDPMREVSQYIEIARKRNCKIKYIFETHFHADFVSGHIDLSEKTGAIIVYGPTDIETGFHAHIGKDGEEFKLGNIMLKLIHTPGHTMESSCYLLIDEGGNEEALFTGDTLFIGDVGRPDLAQHVIAELTEEKLAGKLFDSLREKVMPLRDDLIVYPGHGAGSACGKNMAKETRDTLGNQKKTNYALNPNLTKEQFIKVILEGLTPSPGYFPKNVWMNIKGYPGIDHVLQNGTRPLSLSQFDALRKERNTQIIDTRDPNVFKRGFIPGSWNIGLDGNFAIWVGTLVEDINKKVLLITDPGKEQEAVTRLARVGYNQCIGFLDGGFLRWQAGEMEIDRIPAIAPSVLATIQEFMSVNIIDVRKKNEFDEEHIMNAINIPLDYIHDELYHLNKDSKFFIHCAGGYRSIIFISILKTYGFKNLVNIDGGFSAMKKTLKFSLSHSSCQPAVL